jgi:hypothetical protein
MMIAGYRLPASRLLFVAVAASANREADEM